MEKWKSLTRWILSVGLGLLLAACFELNNLDGPTLSRIPEFWHIDWLAIEVQIRAFAYVVGVLCSILVLRLLSNRQILLSIFTALAVLMGTTVWMCQYAMIGEPKGTFQAITVVNVMFDWVYMLVFIGGSGGLVHWLWTRATRLWTSRERRSVL